MGKATISLRMLASILLLLLSFDAFRIDRRKKRGKKHGHALQDGLAMQTLDPVEEWLKKNGYTEDSEVAKKTKRKQWRDVDKFPLFTAIKRKDEVIAKQLMMNYRGAGKLREMLGKKYDGKSLDEYAAKYNFKDKLHRLIEEVKGQGEQKVPSIVGKSLPATGKHSMTRYGRREYDQVWHLWGGRRNTWRKMSEEDKRKLEAEHAR